MLFAADPVPPVGGMVLWFDFADPSTFTFFDGTTANLNTPATAEVYGLTDKSVEKPFSSSRGVGKNAVNLPIKSNKGWRYLGRNNPNAINGKSVLYTEGKSVMTGEFYNYPDLTLFVLFRLANNLNGASRCPIFGQSIYYTGDVTYSPLVYGLNANVWTKTPSGALVSNQPLLQSYGWKRIRHEKAGDRVENRVGNLSGGYGYLNYNPLPNDYKVGYLLGGDLNLQYMDTAFSLVSGYYAEIIAYDRVLTTAEINSVESYLIQKWGGNNPTFGS
jgi:hypothetical protein